MFSVADLLDRAKAGANIESDYRLAKVIGITHAAVSGYRAGKTMPDARVLEQLCALSGDDLAMFAIQAQAERERTPEGKAVWLMVAKRLAGGATTAVLSVVFAISLIAGGAQDARASGLYPQKAEIQIPIHRIKYVFVSAAVSMLDRLQRYRGLFRLSFALCLAS